ncbi:MAG: tRNA (cytidine(34)-2'-O)-methyltransferase [Spirochaetota bacterium]
MSSNTFEGPTIVLHRPQIPQNTGNVSRLCVALNAPLVITGRPGFRLDEASVRRAGLDHWQHLRFSHHSRFSDFWRENPQRRFVMVSKTGRESALEFDYRRNDILVFGNETMGLPPVMLNRFADSVYLPMSGPVRSLNLSNSVAVVAYAYVHAVFGSAARHGAEAYPRTYYREHRRG